MRLWGVKVGYGGGQGMRKEKKKIKLYNERD